MDATRDVTEKAANGAGHLVAYIGTSTTTLRS
jgi:hypothetical protein